MSSNYERWLTREREFSAFATGPLLDFWRTREEAQFLGVDNVPIRYVRYCSAKHNKVILVSTGRIESYVKYAEVAYDLFHSGFDVFIMDHRGQGRSGRVLQNSSCGHVERFDDYVTDLGTFYQLEIAPRQYTKKFALAHSMGGAILSLFLARTSGRFDAAALCAPMIGIPLPLPLWISRKILNWMEKYPRRRNSYALGTGQWNPAPFGVNRVTHSRARYRRNVRFYADGPELRVGGPTYHWVRESIHAGEQILREAKNISTPLLLLQADDERVVDNRAQFAFCQAMSAAGHPCEGNDPLLIEGARHEILFERDPMRTKALDTIMRFFARYT